MLFKKQIEDFKLQDVTVLADRAYSTYEIIENLNANVAVICIEPKTNMKYVWEYDKTQYKKRNKIERFFKRLKDNRRIATRYDRLDSLYLSFVYFSSILYWILYIVNIL